MWEKRCVFFVWCRDSYGVDFIWYGICGGRIGVIEIGIFVGDRFYLGCYWII